MTHIEYVRQRLEGHDRILELADELRAEGLPRIEVAKILEGAAKQGRREDHAELLEAERAAGIVRGWPPAPGIPAPGEDKEIPQRANGVGDE